MTTLLADKFVTQIAANVAALEQRVDRVADLAELVRQNALPQRMPASYVLPIGLSGATPDAVSGLYRQWVNQLIGVVLIAQSTGDPKAQKAAVTIDTLIIDTIAAVAGWIPASDDGDTSVYGAAAVQRGALVSVRAGLVIYQITFQLMQQFRIARP